MMKTPILDFVREYAAEGRARFHMPGHKGQTALGCEPWDITEIDGADVLYDACGIIEESEKNASSLFGTAHSYYSTEGSSLCIKAMLALVTEGRSADRPLILAARNAHRAFVYACALLDLDVEWLMPRSAGHLCSCEIDAEQVEDAILHADRMPTAVYLTSPDYLGQVADVEGIARVCHAHGIPLLVDNAHGAYLKFLAEDRHPITLGADICCDSAHKTLPVLTGGAYLHVSKRAEHYCAAARRMLSIFASTSPSYLILQSLDLCNRYLAEEFSQVLADCVRSVEHVREQAEQNGISFDLSEPLKLVLRATDYGYTGEEIAEHVRKYGVEAEMADGEYLVLMASPQNSPRDFLRLNVALSNLKIREALELPEEGTTARDHERVCTIREAVLLCRQERIPVADSAGRVCASPTVSCPPAVPIVMCGERITAEDVARFERYGIDEVDVIVEE